ncbi:MAG TPA: phosphopantetheine-binding protein, partial [Candidatus Kapabacteria bacterium]|nr:phosphopantetheine-binding protein [Candidatus Kapabacteria bacterium]
FYKTGDLASWLSDGNIEFLGRIDQQVKIRGFRIELGEIESRLNRHTAVKESVVIAINDPGGENSLCAYIVKSAENHEEICVEHWRDYLSKTLPEYMIPSYFITLEKIPLTTNGKVDRHALPPPQSGKTLRSGAAYEKPRSEIEEKIANLWQEILKIKKIGIHDNFFSLGGHSLKAMNFAGQVYQIFNLEIPLRIIFDTPTVASIAHWIQVTMDKRRKLMQILLEIEALSDEQVMELISRENICYNNNGGLL